MYERQLISPGCFWGSFEMLCLVLVNWELITMDDIFSWCIKIIAIVVGVMGPRFNCGFSPDLDLPRELEKQVSILFSRYGASWHKHSWLIHHRLVTLTRPSQQFSDLPTPHNSNIGLKSSDLLCWLHAANWVYEFVGQLWALIYNCLNHHHHYNPHSYHH